MADPYTDRDPLASDDAASPDQGDLFGGAPKPSARHHAMPSFAATRPAHPGRQRWLWLLVVLLAALLLAQSLYAERDRLAADARWRPWLLEACELLGCTLPPWRELSALRITAREVRPHPSVPGALLITATFRNDALYAQPWPWLELRLQDLDGRDVAMRRFAPAEYLGAAPASPLIAPGQSANVTLEVLDPDRAAIAFAFDFR
ncbi:DUF3426 domain-containing protein [Rehaibacterium terrae]|jgi:hypothetical protein|uniref:DUF3426 domain-containing protein n=1 Tax=Rehaibacterium terrae TaxID=1341696 RepID=A0A7W7XZR2_9GAMM|nr:DUF3426 domain-containing protein [Rehaibacterium terrae]MBB5015449.1 hypothetical protein [Rehaibacterium terrae]